MLPTPYFVYMLLCAGDTIYTGITSDLAVRITAHCKSTGAKYTRSHKPMTLLAYWECESRSEALKLEWKFKRLKPQQKMRLAQEQKAKNTLPLDGLFQELP
jgi:putative endonuclease